MRSKRKGFLNQVITNVNYIIELIILMLIFVFLGIILQSSLVTSLGFLIAAILTLLINFVKIRPTIFYIITIPSLLILLIFVPKILI